VVSIGRRVYIFIPILPSGQHKHSYKLESFLWAGLSGVWTFQRLPLPRDCHISFRISTLSGHINSHRKEQASEITQKENMETINMHVSKPCWALHTVNFNERFQDVLTLELTRNRICICRALQKQRVCLCMWITARVYYIAMDFRSIASLMKGGVLFFKK